jgi:G3E family GTPase
MDTQFEPVKQAAVADRLLITKCDLITDEDAEALSERLRAINPAAPIHTIRNGDVAPDTLFGAGLYDPETKSPDVARWLRDEAYADDHDDHHHHDVNRHDDRIRAFCLISETRMSWDAFADWMEALISTHGDALLRVKGILHVTDTDNPVAVHGVQHVFHPPAMLDAWPDDDRRSRIVMITRDLNREPVERMFRAFIDANAP